MGLANKLFKGDRSVWIIFMLLCFVSLVEVYSATSTLAFRNTYFWQPIMRHAEFLLLGFGIVLLFHNIPNRFFSAGIILLPISIALLVITLFIGTKTNDAQRFLSFMGFTFQPSEFAKLSCIIFTAFVLSRKSQIFDMKMKFWIILIGVGITCVFIFVENLSTAVLLFGVCFMMMFVGQIPFKRLFLVGLAMIASVALVVGVYSVAPEKVKEMYPSRFTTWMSRVSTNDSGGGKYVIDGDKKDYQEKLAKVAIARGGLLGQLPGRSTQRDYLPQAYSDFIYAIIIEELGLIVGGMGVLMLYVFLMFRVAIIARRCEKQFPKYLALGCGLLIVVQAFINMAVAVDLIPVTGQPLPLISRGGTSTVITCCYFGIILSVSRFSAGMDMEDEEKENHIEDAVLDEGEELVVDIQGIENIQSAASEEDREKAKDENIET